MDDDDFVTCSHYLMKHCYGVGEKEKVYIASKGSQRCRRLWSEWCVWFL